MQEVLLILLFMDSDHELIALQEKGEMHHHNNQRSSVLCLRPIWNAVHYQRRYENQTCIREEFFP